MTVNSSLPTVSFIRQNQPVEEYERAMCAIARSVFRAYRDGLSKDDLEDLNTSIHDITLRQLAKISRVERDKGLRGDGFEWAVHEAIVGRETRVLDLVQHAMGRASPSLKSAEPSSLMFGFERAKYIGFLDAVVTDAGQQANLLPDSQGRPFSFARHVPVAAQGQKSEQHLPARIQQIWKTDLFVTGAGTGKYLGCTVKSNPKALEGGRGLRLAVVPEGREQNSKEGVKFDSKTNLWTVTLADPSGFMGVFNDAYNAVARAICVIGKHELPSYFAMPSAKAARLQDQIVKYATAKVTDIEGALDEAAQQDLVTVSTKPVSVNPPAWLTIQQKPEKIISPMPIFDLNLIK